ncbi:MAG: hypothetical protein HYV59_05250 [Planctomycetes bacterium]|nr:hypothetical protein [Planctomycetota bacterium]
MNRNVSVQAASPEPADIVVARRTLPLPGLFEIPVHYISPSATFYAARTIMKDGPLLLSVRICTQTGFISSYSLNSYTLHQPQALA